MTKWPENSELFRKSEWLWKSAIIQAYRKSRKTLDEVMTFLRS